jgi:hypothetical protein
MQVIVYKIDGEPRLISPEVIVTDILDDDGNPTGETVTTDNLQQLIAALPEGTQYTLIDGADAATWWADNQSPAELAEAARAKRAALLTASDWTQIADNQLDNDTRAAWVTYRQALRDITGQPGFPQTIDWPEPPA